MGKTIIKIIFILSISLNIALAIHLFTPGTQAGEDQPLPLNLTETQKKQMSQIHLEKHSDNETLKRNIAKCQRKMVGMLKAQNINKEEIYQCIDKISALQKDLQLNTVDTIIRMKKVLDKKQCSCLMDGLNSEMVKSSPECTNQCCKPKPK